MTPLCGVISCDRDLCRHHFSPEYTGRLPCYPGHRPTCRDSDAEETVSVCGLAGRFVCSSSCGSEPESDEDSASKAFGLDSHCTDGIRILGTVYP